MQREGSAIDSFPESIDLNHGSLPDNISLGHPVSWDNMSNPVENRMPNYMLATADGTACSHMNSASGSAPRFSGWNHDESISYANNIHGLDDSGMRPGWPFSFDVFPGHDSRLHDWSFQQCNGSSSRYVGNRIPTRSVDMENYSSVGSSVNLAAANPSHVRNHDSHRILGAIPPQNSHKLSHTEMDHISNCRASSSNLGTSSGFPSTYSENNDAAGPSFSTWGSSCKRKALEGSTGQTYPGGCSGSNQPLGKNVSHHPVPGCHTAAGNLSPSSGPLNLSLTNQSELLNSSVEFGMNRVASAFLRSSSVSTAQENSARNFATRSTIRHHDSVPFGSHRDVSAELLGVYPAQSSASITNAGSLHSRSTMRSPVNPDNSPNRPRFVHVDEAAVSHPCVGSFSSRGISSSFTFLGSGDGGHAVHEEGTIRNSRRSNADYPITVYAPETRNVLQDGVDWSFVPEISPSSRNHSFGPRAAPISRTRSSASWLPPQSPTAPIHNRISETAPWLPFPRVESESGGPRSHFTFFPSPSISSNEGASTSRAQHQPDHRSAAIPTDLPGDNSYSLHALSALEGRQRLIRQVLNAMRRDANFQAEDYMLIDPFVSGLAEMQDRHRDLRLDVDNMSYEELLALEERIGNVNTGLSEEKIKCIMNRRKYTATRTPKTPEPCCICQDEYVTGDDVGILDCGHEFHTVCVKQWLKLKNLCPICKVTALETSRFRGKPPHS